MLFRVLADLVLVVHLAFIGFAALGGLLAIRWRWMPLLHIPAVAWGAYIELSAGVCPLTPLENALRQAGRDPGYSGGFIEQYLEPLIYPSGLSDGMQLWLGIGLVLLNLVIYAFVLWRRRSRPLGSAR